MDKSLDEIIRSQPPVLAAKPEGGASSSDGVSKRGNRRRGARSSGRSSGSPYNKQQQRGNGVSMKTVAITNLHENISEDDLRDLFRQVGPVVRVEIQRGRNGERTGVAWVVYDYSEDAIVAAERFNSRKAAGQTIHVHRVQRVGQSNPVSLGERIGGNSSKSSRKRGSGRKSEGQKKASRTPRSASDLDAELDAYMDDSTSAGPPPVPKEESNPEPLAPAPESAPPAEEAMIEV